MTMTEGRTLAVTPTNVEAVPWIEGCRVCTVLRMDPQPGLFAWVESVGGHMETEHDIVLVNP